MQVKLLRFIGGLSVLFIEKPYTEIEISGKSHPEEIGDLQPRREFINFTEREDHP